MRKAIQHFLWILGLTFGLQHAQGFALLGPGIGGGQGADAPWQTPPIGYGLPGDVGTPKNIGEEFRRNTPVMYYAYDSSFLDFFGSNGVVAVDQAFSIMNSLTNVDDYSANLSEFPLNAQSYNYEAQSAGLTDLKSVALYTLMEQMGLAEPERYVWTLHDRYLPSPGTCPEDELYLVVQRNFDFETSPLDQIQYSSYINGTLYSYEISEHCTGPDPLAVTVPFNTDPSADIYTAVAGLGTGFGETTTNIYWIWPEIGGFYTGLTRDDVAGLRYLLNTNNINYESQAAGSFLEATNFNSNQLLVTSDLGLLLAEARTNDPVTLATLVPGLVVSSFSNYFTVGVITNITAYFTNAGYGSTYGSPPILAFATNYTYVPVTNYVDTFANVVIVSSNANTRAILQTIMTTNYNGGTFGLPPTTNTINQVITLTNVPSGDYFLIPTNSCGYNIVSTLFTNVTIVTNFITGASTNFNAGTSTNGTSTNLNLSATVNLITYVTNHWFTVNPCNLETNATGLYEGIGRVQFIKASYDSLVGQYFQPITNTYTMTYVTNSQSFTRTFQRVVTQPDILYSATDLTSPNPPVAEIGAAIFKRNVNFDADNSPTNLAGPGIINPSSVITFNKVGDVYGNGSLALDGVSFLGQYTQAGLLAWGSFDASTNVPVVYPNGTSIQNLENQILIRISPSGVPDGTNGAPYVSQTFSVTGGGAFTKPFTWSASSLSSAPTNSASGSGLPAGLALISNSDSTATLSGTPTNNPAGTYDFTIQLTDANFRSVNWNYSIIIH